MSDKDATGKKTVVEEGTDFRGSMTSSCPIEVRGRIDGELSTPSLAVSATGSVSGKGKIGTLKSQGELAGEFDADTVQLSGTVKDKTVIRAKTLDVKLSSDTKRMEVTFGDAELEVGDSPEANDGDGSSSSDSDGESEDGEGPPAGGELASEPPPSQDGSEDGAEGGSQDGGDGGQPRGKGEGGDAN